MAPGAAEDVRREGREAHKRNRRRRERQHDDDGAGRRSAWHTPALARVRFWGVAVSGVPVYSADHWAIGQELRVWRICGAVWVRICNHSTPQSGPQFFGLNSGPDSGPD